MATLQVRSIDDQLYEALGKRAAQDNRSISQEVVAILREYLSSPDSSRRRETTATFLDLCGSWQDDRLAEEIVRSIRESRRSISRFQEEF